MTGTRVTCEDLETGEIASVVILDNYVIVTDGKCSVSDEVRHSNGTVVATIKRPISATADFGGVPE